MDEQTHYEDNHGVKVTDNELILGRASSMESLTSIAMSDIDGAVFHADYDWKPGLGFVGAGLVIFYFSSSWPGYLFAIAALAYGGWILFHPRNRHYNLFVRKSDLADPNLPNYPLKPYAGNDGRSAVNGLVAAIEIAKRRAQSGQ